MSYDQLKIAQIIDSLAVGGAERVAVDISNMLVQKGAKLNLILMRTAGELLEQLDQRVNITVLNFDKKTDFNGWRRLNRALIGHDLLHVHMRHTYGRVKLATRIYGIHTPIVFHDHFGDIRLNRVAPLYLKGIFQPAWYIGVSRELAEWAGSCLRLPESRVFVLPNTILRNTDIQFDASRSGVVLVSNIRRSKNIEFAIALSNKMGFPLDIVGQVTDQEYYMELKALCSNNQIRFITNASDVFSMLGSYKLAIHTAKSETGPLVLLEYLKAGLPFITFRTGEVAEHILKVFPMFVMDIFDMNRWQEQITFMLNTSYHSEDLRKVFLNSFSPARYMEQLNEIYHCATGF